MAYLTSETCSLIFFFLAALSYLKISARCWNHPLLLYQDSYERLYPLLYVVKLRTPMFGTHVFMIVLSRWIVLYISVLCFPLPVLNLVWSLFHQILVCLHSFLFYSLWLCLSCFLGLRVTNWSVGVSFMFLEYLDSDLRINPYTTQKSETKPYKI